MRRGWATRSGWAIVLQPGLIFILLNGQDEELKAAEGAQSSLLLLLRQVAAVFSWACRVSWVNWVGTGLGLRQVGDEQARTRLLDLGYSYMLSTQVVRYEAIDVPESLTPSRYQPLKSLSSACHADVDDDVCVFVTSRAI